ncbi:MAG: hypothetical protein AAF458_11400 [Pseudomonadota bacterium]
MRVACPRFNFRGLFKPASLRRYAAPGILVAGLFGVAAGSAAQDGEWVQAEAGDMVVQIAWSRIGEFNTQFRRKRLGFQEYEGAYSLRAHNGGLPMVEMLSLGLSPAGQTWISDGFPTLAELAPRMFKRFETFTGPPRKYAARQGPVEVRPFTMDGGLRCVFFLKWAADFEFDVVPSAEYSAGVGKAVAAGAYCTRPDLTDAERAAEADAFIATLSMPDY